MYELHLQEGNNVEIYKLKSNVNLIELEAELNRAYEERLNDDVYFRCYLYRVDGMDRRLIKGWEISVC